MELLKKSIRSICRILYFALIIAGIMQTVTSCRTAASAQYIEIDSRSPWYWNYKGKTVLLLGGSWQDNLFNHPGGLEEHLDMIASVGGNYLRNTMSHRNEGNVFAGAASARFHRPHPIEDPAMMYEKSDFGLGISLRAQKVIKSLRMATDELDIALTQPGNDLLSGRDDNEAYLLAEPGRQYALYFPDGGSVELDMSHGNGQWNCRWINLDHSEWSDSTQVRGGMKVRLTTPGKGHWIAVLLPAPGPA